MDLTEAIRVAEKIKPWINRMPERVAALDALLDLARERVPKATAESSRSSDFMAKWDEFWGDMFGMPPEEEKPPAPAEPVKTRELDVVTWEEAGKLPARSKFVSCDPHGMPHGGATVNAIGGVRTSEGAMYALVLYRAPAEPKAEAKPAPKVGDLVPWADLDSLQVGTVVAWVSGMRGIVRADGGAHDVAWSDAKLRGGGTVRVVLLPEEESSGAQ